MSRRKCKHCGINIGKQTSGDVSWAECEMCLKKGRTDEHAKKKSEAGPMTDNSIKSIEELQTAEGQLKKLLNDWEQNSEDIRATQNKLDSLLRERQRIRSHIMEMYRRLANHKELEAEDG